MMKAPSKIDVEQLMELDLHLALSDLKIEEDTSKVSGETLDYIANLARIRIQDDEKEEFYKHLEGVISFADQLNEVNCDAVEPLSFIADQKNVFRKDVHKPSLSVKEALKNAPSSESNYFSVPKSIGGK